jgi:hypothetical protein
MHAFKTMGHCQNDFAAGRITAKVNTLVFVGYKIHARVHYCLCQSISLLGWHQNI